MKKILFVIVCFALHANEGCMDRSYHAYQCCGDGCELAKYDNKTLFYVECYCDCDRYQQSPKRGKCPQCFHFHDPGADEVIQVEDDTCADM